MPSPAVQVGQDGAHVFVVKEDLTVEDRPIDHRHDRRTARPWSKQGLTPGERVVTDGQLQLTDGVKVEERGSIRRARPRQPAGHRASEAARGKQ